MSQKRFLIIEDSQHDAEFILRWLERFHADTVCVPSFEDALLYEDEKWHAVFVNLKLGPDEMAGIEVIRHFRRRELDLPIFVVTGYETEQARQAAIRAGASGFFGKDYRSIDGFAIETVLATRGAAVRRGEANRVKSWHTTIGGALAGLGTFLWGVPVALNQFPDVALPTETAKWLILSGIIASGAGVFFTGLFARSHKVSDEQAGAGVKKP